jgi:hypothetical protein
MRALQKLERPRVGSQMFFLESDPQQIIIKFHLGTVRNE